MDAVDNTERNAALYAANIRRFDFVLELLKRGAHPNKISTTGGSIAGVIYRVESSERIQPSESLLQTKALLIEKGVPYPPPTPAEQREIRARQQQ